MQQTALLYHYDDEEQEEKIPGKARWERQAPCNSGRAPSKADWPLTNWMRNNEDPFSSILVKGDVMKDMYKNVEYHNKQRELYWEKHQAVVKDKTEE